MDRGLQNRLDYPLYSAGGWQHSRAETGDRKQEREKEKGQETVRQFWHSNMRFVTLAPATRSSLAVSRHDTLAIRRLAVHHGIHLDS